MVGTVSEGSEAELDPDRAAGGLDQDSGLAVACGVGSY
jgi:hypothetical protein